MKPADKVGAVTEFAVKTLKRGTYSTDSYPNSVLDIILFHKLHLLMAWERALKSYQLLREQFVDWNEVRVSSVREIQEHLKGAERPLELAVFIKDFLEHVQRERHNLCLKFLDEANLTEVRRFFKPIKGIDASTVEMVLLLRKAHPVLPLTAPMETVAVRFGLASKTGTRDQRQKKLYSLAEPERVLALHHYLLDLSRRLCPGGQEEGRIPSLPANNVDGFLKQVVKEVQKRAKPGRRKSTKDGKGAAGDRRKTPAKRTSAAAAKSRQRQATPGTVIRRAVVAKQVRAAKAKRSK